MTETTRIDAYDVEPWNGVDDKAKLDALIESMERDGWIGAPILVIDRDGASPRAITGSHRIAAARQAGIDVPAVDLDDLLAEHGTSLAELDEEYGDRFEAIVRLDYHLPVDVVDYYGLDAH